MPAQNIDASLDGDRADATLAAAGDERAFSRLYARHAVRMHVLARRLVGADDADDATQEVFLRAWTKLRTFRGESSLGTWLHRLAVNVLIRRAAQLRREASRTIAGVPDTFAAPGPQLEDRMAADALLAMLVPELRCVVVLHDMEGYSHDDIAQLLGIGAGASRMRLHRARMTLRAHLHSLRGQSQ